MNKSIFYGFFWIRIHSQNPFKILDLQKSGLHHHIAFGTDSNNPERLASSASGLSFLVALHYKPPVYTTLYSSLHYALQWFTLYFTVVYTTLYNVLKLRFRFIIK